MKKLLFSVLLVSTSCCFGGEKIRFADDYAIELFKKQKSLEQKTNIKLNNNQIAFPLFDAILGIENTNNSDFVNPLKEIHNKAMSIINDMIPDQEFLNFFIRMQNHTTSYSNYKNDVNKIFDIILNDKTIKGKRMDIIQRLSIKKVVKEYKDSPSNLNFEKEVKENLLFMIKLHNLIKDQHVLTNLILKNDKDEFLKEIKEKTCCNLERNFVDSIKKMTVDDYLKQIEEILVNKKTLSSCWEYFFSQLNNQQLQELEKKDIDIESAKREYARYKLAFVKASI